MPPLWATPLLLMPGVALLVMSTQARYGQLHAEMHRLIDEHHHHDPSLIDDLIRRGRLFRSALVCLYTACTIFGLGALTGGLAELMIGMSTWASWGAYILSLVGVLLLVSASSLLIREAALSLRILEYHHQELQEPKE